MRRASLQLLVYSIVSIPGCQKQPGPTTSPTVNEHRVPATPTSATPEVDAPAVAPATPSPAIGPREGLLEGLEIGDRACYVQLAIDEAHVSIEGDFELCPGAANDASKLVGKRVSFTTIKASVLAASCQGDASCGKSDMVDMIATISLVGGSDDSVTLDELDAGDAVKLFGNPASKHSEEWAADGAVYTEWKWPGSGVELITRADGSVHSVTCAGACTLRTELGLGVGSTTAEVKNAYGKAINKRESNAHLLVVGDAYGGVFFDLKAGKVVRVFIGAAAE